MPMSKDKKNPQWDGRRGAIMLKSSPILAGWAAHKLENNNTKEVLPLLWRFWAPCQASYPGDLARGLGILRESDFEGQWDLITDFHRTGENRLDSGRAQTEFCVSQDPEKRRNDLTGHWLRPTCLCWRVPYGGVGQQWLPGGAGTLATAALEGAPWRKPFWRAPLALP